MKPTIKQSYVLLVILLVTCVWGPLPTVCPAQQRRFTVDDMFKLEEIGPALFNADFSPDGKYFAFVLKRPKSGPATYMRSFANKVDRGDIWVVDTSRGSPEKITNGAADGSGYWSPVWSPDSNRLALYSDKGGNITQWIWDRSTRGLRQLSKRGVQVCSPPIWLSDHELLFGVIPPDRTNLGGADGYEIAAAAWQKSMKGEATTSSVLQSGQPIPDGPLGEIILANLETGASRVIATEYVYNLFAVNRGFAVSPDKRYVAFFRRRGSDHPSLELVVASVQGREISAVTVADRSLDPWIGMGWVDRWIKWSPNGRELAFFEGQIRGSGSVFRYTVGDKAVRPVSSPAFGSSKDSLGSVSNFIWTPNGSLVLRAQMRSDGGDDKSARIDWWIAKSDDQFANLTARMRSVPQQVWNTPKGDALVGIAGGEIWTIHLSGEPPQRLDPKPGSRFEVNVWPSQWNYQWPRQSDSSDAVVLTSSKHLYKFDLGSGALTPLPKPVPTAGLFAFDLQRNTAVYKSDTRDGMFLWIQRDQQSRLIVQTNMFLKDVAEGGTRLIEYKSQDGKPLKARIILPPLYEEGKKYPVVVSVYEGSVSSEESRETISISRGSFLNLQLLSAHGFVVLIPSIPLGAWGEASDPYFEFPKMVLPAIDKAVELQLADPGRVAVIGHSYGGYITDSLITQTNRFKAAVALAGPTDLLGIYGVLHPGFRYKELTRGNDSIGYFNGVHEIESGQFRMGGPPWKDRERFIRNSPISYVDRIETPLMIVQGDMDFVPIEQGEQLFAALFRQQKRAAFVRYWGEGHNIQTPANIRDLWYRIYAWLDEFLDISRDSHGNLTWHDDKTKSRNGTPPLKADDFARFDLFQQSPARQQSLPTTRTVP